MSGAPIPQVKCRISGSTAHVQWSKVPTIYAVDAMYHNFHDVPQLPRCTMSSGFTPPRRAGLHFARPNYKQLQWIDIGKVKEDYRVYSNTDLVLKIGVSSILQQYCSCFGIVQFTGKEQQTAIILQAYNRLKHKI